MATLGTHSPSDTSNSLTRLDELGKLTVRDVNGAVISLGSLWADQPTVLVWLRHFG